MEPKEGSAISGMKLSCTVHGPRSLPRSAPYSPHMVLSTHVKYAPFATRQRKGYQRDSHERDLGMHLATALRGSIIADQWPKSGVDVVVTIIEGEMPRHTSDEQNIREWDFMNVLSGCITVAAAAIADAGIDCIDTVCGGVAALVVGQSNGSDVIVLDPIPSEYEFILAACCVAYLPGRDEITNIWLKGRVPSGYHTHRTLVSRAVHASRGAYQSISASLQDTVVAI